MTKPLITVVMLVESDQRDVTPYLARVHKLLTSRGVDHEFIVAANGSGSRIREFLVEWPEDGPRVRLVELTRRLSQGACLQAVLPDCSGEFLLVCGLYQQIADQGLEDLVDAAISGQVDLVLPWRKERIDRQLNQLQSRIFNRLVRMVTGTRLHDFSSEVRVIRRSVLEEIVLYGDHYRYLPLLAEKRGFRVKEIVAKHVDERDDGAYYGVYSYLNRLADIVTMGFNVGFARQPLRYFGPRGAVLVGVGALMLAVAIVQKVAKVHALGDSPLVMIGLALNVTGFLFWGSGLLGEIVVFTMARKRKEYVVEQVIEGRPRR